VYGRLAGYEDVGDAERLCPDPNFRLIGSEKTWDRGVALTSRLQWFETELLAELENPGRFEDDQPGTDREGRSDGFTAAGGAGHQQH